MLQEDIATLFRLLLPNSKRPHNQLGTRSHADTMVVGGRTIGGGCLWASVLVGFECDVSNHRVEQIH